MVVECLPEEEEGGTASGEQRSSSFPAETPFERPRRSSLSSKASSFFDIHSFPLSQLELLNSRNEFEELFDITPQLHCESLPLTSRLVVDPAPPSVMDHPAPPKPQRSQSLVAKVFQLGFGHGDRSPGAVPETHNAPSSNSNSSSNTSSSSKCNMPGFAASLEPEAVEHAAREAIDTPLTIHSQPSATAYPRKAPSHMSLRRPLQLLGRKDDVPKALTTTIANELRLSLPVQERLAKSWHLVYSMDQHGISMNTMMAQCAHEKALVLAIKDTTGRVFGAFLNEPLRFSPSFYGQGTSFLWKAFRSSPQSRKKDAVRCFKYSGENEYFILCDPDFVAIGGGRGKFGLWFKGDFLHGYSARCPTFNNEPLCLDPAHPKNKEPDAQQEFAVGHLELWAFDP